MRLGSALAIVALLGSACSSSGGKLGEQPSWRTSGKAKTKELGPIVFAPSRPAVAAYNATKIPKVKPTELADAISVASSEVAAKLGKPIPAIDPRLSAAAAELASIAPADAQLAYPLIEFAMQRYGIIEPSPHIIVIWGERDQKPSEVVNSLRERLPEILEPPTVPHTRLGVGVAKRGDDESCIVVAFQSSYIETAPIPRAVRPGGMITVDGVIKAPYSDPQVFVTREDGAVERPPVTRDDRSGGFKTNMSCGRHRGRQQIEITAIDASGSTVLANFPVWCGETPPARIVHRASIDETAPIKTEEQGAQRMLRLLNIDRKKHGLAPLGLDARLSQVARKHSLEMKVTGRVAHVSPVTGSAADRVDKAGIRTSVVLENVARAYGIAQAQAGLMNSPGHRSNILAREASHVGIGVVFGQE
ncbi:MAG: CAP domain-containing protein, partial [Deltaproteobacteria bacterium]|nr:CAP domain-containing protein [Deltaproteobacteria bacterium]